MAQAGNMNDWLSSDTALWAAPLALGFLSGATPGTARAAHGIATGLHMVGQAQEQQRQQAQREEMRKRLSSIFGQTQPVSSTSYEPQIETERGDAPVGDRPVTTTRDVPIFSPAQQKLGEALAASDRPELAVSIAERALSRQQQQPHTFGSPETGYYTVGPNGEPINLVQGVGRRQPTPPRPVYATQGGEGVQSVYNPQTGAWEEKRTPLTPAPARQLSPEDAAVKRAQVAREARLQKLADQANDPKATREKLNTFYANLQREREHTYDEDKIAEIDSIMNDVRSRLAEMARSGASEKARPSKPGQGRASKDSVASRFGIPK